MNEIVVLAFSGSGVLGGGETLIMRMVQWLHDNGYRIFVMHNASAAIVPSFQDFLDEHILDRIVIPDLDGRADLPNFIKARAHFPKGSRIRILCIQSSFIFFAAQALAHVVHGCEVNVVHYIIHENDYCRNLSEKTANSLIQLMFKHRYRRLVSRMERNWNVAYMTESYRDNIHRVLGMRENSTVPVVRLGMDVDEYSEEQNRQRFRCNHFTILATARLDFPTKGFLIGLVDEYEQVLSAVPNARLVIIGDGPGKVELDAKVSASSAKAGISLVGEVAYEQLPRYLAQANIYVSNGTGPLDAAKAGLVSVVANFNTYRCLTTGFWCDEATNLGYNGTIHAHELISKVAKMDEPSYLSLARRNHDVFQKTYGMDAMMHGLLSIQNKLNRPLLSWGYLLYTTLVRKLINSVTRGHK